MLTICLSCQLTTLRGAILEDAIPSTARHGTARGLPLKEVLEYVIPELNIQCLRLALNSPKVPEQLLKLDEQGVSTLMSSCAQGLDCYSRPLLMMILTASDRSWSSVWMQSVQGRVEVCRNFEELQETTAANSASPNPLTTFHRIIGVKLHR